LVRARYTLEFKQEAVRLVRGGQTVSSVAKTLGLSDQTLHNWLNAGKFRGLIAFIVGGCGEMLRALSGVPGFYWL